jgi:SP family general alpha glucoside:H+ symporter-like MFS transporter
MKSSTQNRVAGLGQNEDHIDVASPENDEVINEKQLIAEAAAGFETERELGPWEAAKAYPQAIGWALVMALCVIMEGYDTSLLGNFYAYRT